jgi:hypothetical protein
MKRLNKVEGYGFRKALVKALACAIVIRFARLGPLR